MRRPPLSLRSITSQEITLRAWLAVIRLAFVAPIAGTALGKSSMIAGSYSVLAVYGMISHAVSRRMSEVCGGSRYGPSARLTGAVFGARNHCQAQLSNVNG